MVPEPVILYGLASDPLCPVDGPGVILGEFDGSNGVLPAGPGQDDPVGRVVGQLNTFNVGLERIGEAVANPTLSEATVERLSQIIEGLRAVPVNFEIKDVPVQEGGAPSPVPADELPVAFDTKVEQVEG